MDHYRKMIHDYDVMMRDYALIAHGYSTRLVIYGLSFELLYLFGENRDCFKEVSDDAVVCYVEDGSFRVFVDGDDGLRVLHADEVLYRSTDSERYVELRSYSLA